MTSLRSCQFVGSTTRGENLELKPRSPNYIYGGLGKFCLLKLNGPYPLRRFLAFVDDTVLFRFHINNLSSGATCLNEPLNTLNLLNRIDCIYRRKILYEMSSIIARQS